MPRVVWTEEAEEQLAEIRSDDLVEKLLSRAAGLSRLPERGRKVPELKNHPAYEIVREIILPRKARIFYLFIPDSNEVIVLGILTKGREFRPKILGHYFNHG
jgi:plasmid stabilization system protein ParE